MSGRAERAAAPVDSRNGPSRAVRGRPPGGPDTDVTNGERALDGNTTDDGTADSQRTDSGLDATPQSGY